MRPAAPPTHTKWPPWHIAEYTGTNAGDSWRDSRHTGLVRMALGRIHSAIVSELNLLYGRWFIDAYMVKVEFCPNECHPGHLPHNTALHYVFELFAIFLTNTEHYYVVSQLILYKYFSHSHTRCRCVTVNRFVTADWLINWINPTLLLFVWNTLSFNDVI